MIPRRQVHANPLQPTLSPTKSEDVKLQGLFSEWDPNKGKAPEQGSLLAQVEFKAEDEYSSDDSMDLVLSTCLKGIHVFRQNEWNTMSFSPFYHRTGT